MPIFNIIFIQYLIYNISYFYIWDEIQEWNVFSDLMHTKQYLFYYSHIQYRTGGVIAATDQSRRLIRVVKSKFASTHTIATSPQQMCLEVAVTSSWGRQLVAATSLRRLQSFCHVVNCHGVFCENYIVLLFIYLLSPYFDWHSITLISHF